jgi:hypothetical protein
MPPLYAIAIAATLPIHAFLICASSKNVMSLVGCRAKRDAGRYRAGKGPASDIPPGVGRFEVVRRGTTLRRRRSAALAFASLAVLAVPGKL